MPKYCSAAIEVVAKAVAAATPSSIRINRFIMLPSFLSWLGASMRERPKSQPFFGQLPQPRKSKRLDNQKQDDHHAKDDLLHSGDDRGVDRVAEHGVEKHIEEHRRQQDEAGAEEGAEDRADAAD